MPFIKANELEFYYELLNLTVPWKGSPKNVLFLHGLHGSLRYWKHFQVGPFSQYFSVLNLDQRGHGKSYKPAEGYSIKSMASDVAQILDGLHFNPVHAIGASMGGMVALELTLSYPKLVSSLVMVDSFPYSPPPLSQALRQWIDQVKSKGYANVMKTFNKDNASSLFSFDYLHQRPNFIDFDDQEVLRNLMPSEAFIQACKGIMHYDARDRLTEVDIPTLLIASNEGLGYESAIMMKEQIKNALIWAPEGIGHLINIEQPELFNQYVINFLLGNCE